MPDLITAIKKEAQGLLNDSKGSHDWEHTLRVYKLAEHIGKLENADMKIVRLSAFLHDIGRHHEDSSRGNICHARKSVQIAEDLLTNYKLDSVTREKILHCIGTHRFRDNKVPQSKEAKVLFDADKLDSIGAVGIGRAFLFAGEVGARLHNPGVNPEKTRPYTGEDTAYREYLIKLRKIKNRMMTSEGKRMAKERHTFMVRFFERLNKEVQGLI